MQFKSLVWFFSPSDFASGSAGPAPGPPPPRASCPSPLLDVLSSFGLLASYRIWTAACALFWRIGKFSFLRFPIPLSGPTFSPQRMPRAFLFEHELGSLVLTFLSLREFPGRIWFLGFFFLPVFKGCLALPGVVLAHSAPVLSECQGERLFVFFPPLNVFFLPFPGLCPFLETVVVSLSFARS